MITNGDLQVEYKQCTEEGRDLSSVESEFKVLLETDLSIEENQCRAEALLDKTIDLPVLSSYEYCEPSDLESILANRPQGAGLPPVTLSREELADRALGGWLGRSAGCLLGKPAEGRRAWQIEKYLKAQDRWPLSEYFSSSAPKEVAEECGFNAALKGQYVESIDGMPEDDDTNYTATGLALLRQCGHDFKPGDVMRFWLGNIPIMHVCTAERIAYRNFVNCILPPDSAVFRNPYREWIGAQIRADFFGYVNPGDCRKAAEYAWRDACISHVKNGIYGEMWVAAMLAAAYVSDDVREVIKAGLAQIPAKCRLSGAIAHIMGMYDAGMSYEATVADMSSRWNENNPHDWCHTISNAEIVAIALLWGGKDFEKTICLSVMPGFDTDCNGATSGSVLGVMLGAGKLPGKWIDPLHDTLYTGVAGYNKVSLTQMARETVELMQI